MSKLTKKRPKIVKKWESAFYSKIMPCHAFCNYQIPIDHFQINFLWNLAKNFYFFRQYSEKNEIRQNIFSYFSCRRVTGNKQFNLWRLICWYTNRWTLISFSFKVEGHWITAVGCSLACYQHIFNRSITMKASSTRNAFCLNIPVVIFTLLTLCFLISLTEQNKLDCFYFV